MFYEVIALDGGVDNAFEGEDGLMTVTRPTTAWGLRDPETGYLVGLEGEEPMSWPTAKEAEKLAGIMPRGALKTMPPPGSTWRDGDIGWD